MFKIEATNWWCVFNAQGMVTLQPEAALRLPLVTLCSPLQGERKAISTTL